MTTTVKVKVHGHKVEVTHERKTTDGSYIRSHSSIIEPNSTSEHVFNPYTDMRIVVEEID